MLFDHDGTLVDSENVHHSLWCNVINIDKSLFTEDMYAQHCVGIPSKVNAEYLIARFQLQESIESLLSRKHQVTKSFLETDYFPAMANSLALIKKLASLTYNPQLESGKEW